MRPALVVVSGPPGAGKTTLAHTLAREIGCPAICRDEIKEGMVHGTAAPGEELTLRTLAVFFQVVELLLAAGVTTVAEAAFQHHVWQPRLRPLRAMADVRVVQCHVTAATARARIHHRGPRHAHADSNAITPDAFRHLYLDVPELDVDTTDGYRPGLDEIVAFLNAGRAA